jgi:hypothetical protein
VKVEDIFEAGAQELVEVGENVFEDHLIDLPDHVTVHEGEIENAGVLGIGELHFHGEQPLTDRSVLAWVRGEIPCLMKTAKLMKLANA